MIDIELYSHEAEEALLASGIITHSIDTLTWLQPNDFYKLSHRDVWQAYSNLANRGTPIDITTVTKELQDMGCYDAVGGMAYLTKLAIAPFTMGVVDHYAEIVAKESEKRRVLEKAQSLAKDVITGEYDLSKTVAELASTQHIKGKARHISASLGELMKEVEERSGSPREIWGYSTGFDELDKRIGGLQEQESVYISGRPGLGKSLLAMSMLRNVADKAPCAAFCFEMKDTRTVRRLLSAESAVPTRAMNTGWMNKQWTEFYRGAENLSELPIYISDVPGMTTATLRAEVARLKNLYGIKVVLIDYLEKLLDSDGGSNNDNTALKATRVQAILREFDVAGIIIQSMTKEGFNETVPTLGNMRGPSTLHHEGDCVFLMGDHPDAEERQRNNQPKMVRLFPAKLRDGDMGFAPIDVMFVKGLPKFVPVKKTSIENATKQEIDSWIK